MPANPCAPCDCDPGQLMGNNLWQNDAVLARILCQMLTALNDLVIGVGAAQPANSTVAAVPRNAASVTLLAANANRRGAIFYNDSAAVAYIKLGATASAVSYTVQLNAGGTYILTAPVYTGVVDGLWASAGAGNMLVTEILP